MVVDSSMGREVDTTLQDMPQTRSGGGPRIGQHVLPPQNTPEESLGVGPSNGKHFIDGDGNPTHAGVMRGGGMALASPWPLPQQRVAATPQLGAATDSSPKGVESTTTLALAIECSDVPEHGSDQHRAAEFGGNMGSDSLRQGAMQTRANGAAEVTSVGNDAAFTAVTATDEGQQIAGSGQEVEARRTPPWPSDGAADASHRLPLHGGRGERARLVAHLRGQPRPRVPANHRDAAGRDRHDADEHPAHGGHRQQQGSPAPPLPPCGNVDGSGTGEDFSDACVGWDHVISNSSTDGKNDGSASRGGAPRTSTPRPTPA